MSDARDEARKLVDRSLEFLRSVSGRIEDGVRRTYEASTLRIEISGLRRSLDEALRDLGRRVHDLVQNKGQLTPDEIRVATGRVTHLEEAIAAKERRIAELEAEAGEPGPAEAATGSDPAPPSARARAAKAKPASAVARASRKPAAKPKAPAAAKAASKTTRARKAPAAPKTAAGPKASRAGKAAARPTRKAATTRRRGR